MRATLPSSLLCVLALAVAGCQQATPPAPAAKPEATPAAATPQWRVSDWPLPVAAAAAQPDLIAAPDGGWLLSWIEPGEHGGHALKFARAGRDGRWDAPRRIAAGRDWFVNWADTPHIAASADGALWAHWLQKSAPATYAYDVVLTRSGDGGATWSKPLKVNDDGTATEHGFVSLWPDGADGLGVAWLDGRHTGAAAGEGGHAGHRGAMSLRAARFDAKLARSLDHEIDAMTCDCCQTDAAPTARGPLLVYRDRDAQEIRDIAATRRDGEAWSEPRHVNADRWTMPACPVNGPSVAARGEAALVAWYTAAGGESKVQAARSDDAGTSFGAPLLLDRGEPVQGRVEAALGADAAWVLWLREDKQGQTLWLARLAPDLSRELQRIEVARVPGRGRGTGFAQLALGDGVAYVVWTELVDGAARLRGARVQAEAGSAPDARPQPEATVSSSGESNIAAGDTTVSPSGTRAP
ncbi:sialidase family protein [Lysobacter enzymogenes]|uniref:sialidase family protein n=1 Tax=Lysobacter enzymogenes TaxID=69 RepID=UPI001A977762|nr:sialidase family protein [Lysobacter enzymogenes]QQP95031.1 exo-alpha-sialidase [Lysobacter enzymogenes]